MSSFLIQAVLGLSGLVAAMVSLSSVLYTKVAGAGWRVWDALPGSNAGREVLAHVCGALAPALIPIALCWVSLSVGGQPVATNAVTVKDGPARRGGILDGDRIVAMEGRPTETWQDISVALRRAHASDGQQARPARQVAVVRAGKSITLAVTPDDQGYIRVSPINKREFIGIWGAAKIAVALPSVAITGALSPSIRKDNTATIGPIGIVKETSAHESGGIAEFAYFLGTLGSYFTPVFVLAHLFDWVTLRWFRAANRGALVSLDLSHRSLWRVARVRQLLVLVMGVWLVSDVLWIFIPAAFRFGQLTLAWFVPLQFALGWTASRASRSRVGAALTVLSMAIPFFNLFFVWRLFAATGTFLRNRGVRAAWIWTSAP
ncbi:MAG: hypothetical protein ABI488_05520 [Polyangiaceae bacterium]